MKSVGCWLAVMLVLAWPGGAALAQDREAAEAAEILAQVKKVYGGAAGFRARYDAASRPGVMAPTGAKEKKGQGLILYARPDLLRIIQERPTVEELVLSPAGVWWYRQDINEAHRYPASEFYEEMSPFFGPVMDLFGGGGGLKKWFQIERLVGGDRGEVRAIKLRPLSYGTGLDRLEVWVDPKGIIDELRIYTLAGDLTTYRFEEVEILDSPPEEGFHFSPPIGARIIHH